MKSRNFVSFLALIILLVACGKEEPAPAPPATPPARVTPGGPTNRPSGQGQPAPAPNGNQGGYGGYGGSQGSYPDYYYNDPYYSNPCSNYRATNGAGTTSYYSDLCNIDPSYGDTYDYGDDTYDYY